MSCSSFFACSLLLHCYTQKFQRQLHRPRVREDQQPLDFTP